MKHFLLLPPYMLVVIVFVICKLIANLLLNDAIANAVAIRFMKIEVVMGTALTSNTKIIKYLMIWMFLLNINVCLHPTTNENVIGIRYPDIYINFTNTLVINSIHISNEVYIKQ